MAEVAHAGHVLAGRHIEDAAAGVRAEDRVQRLLDQFQIAALFRVQGGWHRETQSHECEQDDVFQVSAPRITV